jgi:hypothetical protein
MGIHQGWRRDELRPSRENAAAVMIAAFSAGFPPAHGSVAVSHTAYRPRLVAAVDPPPASELSPKLYARPELTGVTGNSTEGQRLRQSRSKALARICRFPTNRGPAIVTSDNVILKCPWDPRRPRQEKAPGIPRRTCW